MHWLGKAPRLWVFSKQALVDEFGDAGFVDPETADVGAKRDIGFIVARRGQVRA